MSENHLGKMHDPISDMVTRLKNASKAGKSFAVMPHSNLKEAIAEMLVRKGYLKSAGKKVKKAKTLLEMELVYNDKKPRISEVKRISLPSKRIYRGANEIRSVRQGTGMAVISTPKGILSDKEARRGKVGGEVLFKIW